MRGVRHWRPSLVCYLNQFIAFTELGFFSYLPHTLVVFVCSQANYSLQPADAALQYYFLLKRQNLVIKIVKCKSSIRKYSDPVTPTISRTSLQLIYILYIWNFPFTVQKYCTIIELLQTKIQTRILSPTLLWYSLAPACFYNKE